MDDANNEMGYHEHIDGQGNIIGHVHTHDFEDIHLHHEGMELTHGHVHSHTQTKAVLNRMSRLIGHMESIRKMVENGRDCSEVLIQISAVKSALNNVGKIILKDHIEHCIVDAAGDHDEQAIKDLNDAIDKFIK